MRKDLPPAIDAPARLCYSKCDTALPLHTGCVSHFSSPPAAECYPPFTPGGRHLSVSPVNALCGVSFFTRQTTLLLK